MSTPTSRTGRVRDLVLPWLVVGAAVLWNEWWLRAESLTVATLDDSSVHEQMVRFAATRLRGGHLPQTSWFPFLGLGSPQFLHYQSLPSTLTGAIGIVLGSDRAFSWSLYLLVSLWPISVYLGARALRWGRWSAAGAAALSPFIVSAVGVGYEAHAYVWIGFGVWTQLWAMWTLPLAWGYSAQAISEGRRCGTAVVFTSLTVLFHFETGYLAVLPLLFLPWLSPSAWRARVARSLVVLAGTLVATAWVTVPVLLSARWASINEILRGTPLENGYGARQVTGWLVTGGLLDAGRLPVITVLAGVGLLACILRFRTDERGRVLVVLLGLCAVLSFGRTTFGALVNVLPGSTDIFMRRFMMGIQLTAVVLAGVGAVAIARTMVGAARRWAGGGVRLSPVVRATGVAALGVLAVAALTPALLQSHRYDSENAAAIHHQVADDSVDGAALAPLLARVQRAGNGRVYAGLPDNWGADFLVGYVPVFKYLESQDIDEVGYTLRTASLMTDPEYYFDQSDPGDYSLFGIRYLLLPVGAQPPVPARLLLTSSPYTLWEVPSVGYLSVEQAVGVVSENRGDVGSASVDYLRSGLPGNGRTLLVDWGEGATARPGSPVEPVTSGRPGKVVTERAQLVDGDADAIVSMDRPGLVVLSASFDPGWQVDVDGRPATPVMVAPALVAVQVGRGTHRVTFRYVGFAGYPVLLMLSGLVLAGALAVDWWTGRTRRRLFGGPDQPPAPVPPAEPAAPPPAPAPAPAPADPAVPAD